VETWRRDAGSFIEMLRQPMDSAKDDTELVALIARQKLLNDLNKAQTLRLDSDVTNNGLRSLNAFPSLTTLFLHSTQVTDAGLKELTHLTNLAVLKIYSAPITNAGLMHLAQIPKLRLLVIAARKVTPQGIAQLQAMRPNLEIMH
jgi:internalin A